MFSGVSLVVYCVKKQQQLVTIWLTLNHGMHSPLPYIFIFCCFCQAEGTLLSEWSKKKTRGPPYIHVGQEFTPVHRRNPTWGSSHPALQYASLKMPDLTEGKIRAEWERLGWGVEENHTPLHVVSLWECRLFANPAHYWVVLFIPPPSLHHVGK